MPPVFVEMNDKKKMLAGGHGAMPGTKKMPDLGTYF